MQDKKKIIPLALFLTCIIFLAVVYSFRWSYSWSPSHQHTNGALFLETLTTLGGFLFIIPAWMVFIRSERRRSNIKINIFSILTTVVGIIVSLFVIWNMITLWSNLGFEMRIALYRLQGNLPNNRVLFCTSECGEKNIVCTRISNYSSICLLKK